MAVTNSKLAIGRPSLQPGAGNMGEMKQAQKPESKPSERSLGRLIKFRVGKEVRELTYQQAFVFGHELMVQKKYDLADAIFGKLCAIPEHGPRAHLLSAICKVGKSDSQAARAILDTAFSSERGLLAAEIHDIIVNSRMGFKEDARHDLAMLASAHEELPTLCLWLGDLFAVDNELQQARKYWEMAMRRDHRGGAAALAAMRQLKKYTVAV
jgi:hypothetical protein